MNIVCLKNMKDMMEKHNESYISPDVEMYAIEAEVLLYSNSSSEGFEETEGEW